MTTTSEANNYLVRIKTWVSGISSDKQEMFLKLFILTSAAILGNKNFCKNFKLSKLFKSIIF